MYMYWRFNIQKHTQDVPLYLCWSHAKKNSFRQSFETNSCQLVYSTIFSNNRYISGKNRVCLTMLSKLIYFDTAKNHLHTYNGVHNGWRLYVATLSEDDVESVDHPWSPGNGEGDDDEQQGDGDVPLLAADAPPFLGRVEAHADSMAANNSKRQQVADGDNDHRNSVARDDDEEEVDKGCDVRRILWSALCRSWLVNYVCQWTDGRCSSHSSPQPRTCMAVTSHTYDYFTVNNLVFIKHCLHTTHNNANKKCKRS